MARPDARPLLTPAEIAELPDTAIDFSDVPELDEASWVQARLSSRTQCSPTDERRAGKLRPPLPKPD